MPTRRNQPMVSVPAGFSAACLAAVLITSLGLSACVARRYPMTQTQRAMSAEGSASVTADEPRRDALQFDNQATVYVDVYLVGEQIQWRLGRVPPGMRATLRIP